MSVLPKGRCPERCYQYSAGKVCASMNTRTCNKTVICLIFRALMPFVSKRWALANTFPISFTSDQLLQSERDKNKKIEEVKQLLKEWPSGRTKLPKISHFLSELLFKWIFFRFRDKFNVGNHGTLKISQIENDTPLSFWGFARKFHARIAVQRRKGDILRYFNFDGHKYPNITYCLIDWTANLLFFGKKRKMCNSFRAIHEKRGVGVRKQTEKDSSERARSLSPLLCQ